MPSPLRLSFIVVGGGIGGLSVAVQLARVGHTVTVLEADELAQDTGAGITVLPNAGRILISLGLGDLLRECGVFPTTVENDGRIGTARTPEAACAMRNRRFALELINDLKGGKLDLRSPS